jgi:hypothetical protein
LPSLLRWGIPRPAEAHLDWAHLKGNPLSVFALLPRLKAAELSVLFRLGSVFQALIRSTVIRKIWGV